MKKYIGTLVAGMTLMAGFPLVGQAADKTTEATVTLEQDPENKDITLDEIPAVNFGTQKIINDSKTYGLLGSSGSTGETALSSSEGVNFTCTCDCVVAACVTVIQHQLLTMRQLAAVISNRPVTNNPIFIGHTSVLL